MADVVARGLKMVPTAASAAVAMADTAAATHARSRRVAAGDASAAAAAL